MRVILIVLFFLINNGKIIIDLKINIEIEHILASSSFLIIGLIGSYKRGWQLSVTYANVTERSVSIFCQQKRYNCSCWLLSAPPNQKIIRFLSVYIYILISFSMLFLKFARKTNFASYWSRGVHKHLIKKYKRYDDRLHRKVNNDQAGENWMSAPGRLVFFYEIASRKMASWNP